MKAIAHQQRRSGTTLVEVMIYVGIAVVISAVAFSFLVSQTRLYAKNMALVRSHSDARTGLDRLVNNLQQANGLPVLITTAGTVTTGAAAGLYFDRYLGDPYVVTHPGGTGLTAAATSLTITRSTVPLASPPLPGAGDTLLIDAPGDPVRAVIATSTPGAIDATNQRQTIALTLKSPLGKAVTWNASQVQTSRLVHREAFIVVPGVASAELRFFPNFEPMPVLTNAANYTVVSNQLGIQAGETLPFSIADEAGDKIVRAGLVER
ncbi:MAG: hypothetical protein ABMA01_22080, partial [Chthoniobacteraceae bacterium]